MQINNKQWHREPKVIGHTDDGEQVYETVTKGGLVMVTASKGKGAAMKTLGVGPHRAVARYVARQKLGDKLSITELSKSDALVVGSCPDLAEYLSLTDRFNSL